MNVTVKRFTGMNKGSKLLIKIGGAVFLVFLLVALTLCILFSADILSFGGQTQLIEWTVLYPFKFWAVTFLGAIVMDILISK